MSLDDKNELAIEERRLSTPQSSAALSDSELLAQDVRPAAERRLVRKLDMRLLPTIIVIFIMNYIDVGLAHSITLQSRAYGVRMNSELRCLPQGSRDSRMTLDSLVCSCPHSILSLC